MTSLEALAQNFNNLEGITLQERQRNFNIYFKVIKKTVSTPEDRKTYCSLLKPRNRFEEVLYTRILLELQESYGLLNIIRSPSHVHLRKIVLNSKLFIEVLKNNFDTIISDEFSKELCFLARIRILIRFGQSFQDDERLDDYYLRIKKKFGLYLAKHLLPACKLKTITEEMKINRVVFNNKQLSKLHERFPNFLEDYFNHLKENNFKHFNKFDKLVRQVAKTDLDLYFKSLTKHELKTKLSISSTTTFVDKYKKEVLKNGEKYLEIIHKRAAFRLLTSDEFCLLYAQLFPKSFNDVKSDLFIDSNNGIMKSLVQRFSRKHRFIILNHVFKKLYNANLLDHEELFNEELLEMVPADLREPIILKKIAKDNKDDWLAFYQLEKALDIIKQKISKTTDPNKRRNLVNCLVKTCRVNNDIQRMTEVFDYIVTRHRNEDASLFLNLFYELRETEMEKFNADHWDSLNKLSKIYFMCKQNNNFSYSDYRMERYTECYWAYKIKNNLSLNDDVTNHAKKYYKDYSLSIFRDKKFSKQRRIVVNILIEIAPRLFKSKNQEFRCFGNFILQTIVDSSKKDKINVHEHPFLIKYITDVIDDSTDSDRRCYIFGILNNLKLKKSSEVYKKAVDRLWKEKPEFYEYKWEFFLQNDPQFIADNYEQFFSLTWFNDQVYKFIENVQYYSHLGIPELFYKKSKELLMESELTGDYNKFNAAVRLLLHSDEFLPVVKRFLPTKPNDCPDEDVNIAQIRITISEVFGNYKKLEDVLKPVLALSKSDNLKYCLQSIYKIIYNLPEAKLSNFLEEIASSKMSLSKHVMFITTRICDQQKVYETLKAIGLKEKDASVQKYLIKSTLGYFNKNPSEEFFELVKDHCKLLTEYDAEGFDLMLILDRIPVQYLSRYVEFIWEFTQSSDIDEIKEIKYKMLQKLDEDLMKTLKPEFLDTLVTKCLDFEKIDADKMYDFIYRYIITGELENTSKRVNFVVSQFPKSVSAKEMQLSKNLYKFTIGFCKKIFTEHKKNSPNAKIILTKFREVWSKTCKFENNFEQATALELAEYFVTCNQTLLIQNTSACLNNLLQKYGNYIIPIFAATFRDQFYAFMKIQELQDDEELFKFILEFLQIVTNIPQGEKEYFVLMTMPKTLPKAINAKEKHLRIVEALEKSVLVSIRMNVVSYINNLEEKMEEHVNTYIPICNMRC